MKTILREDESGVSEVVGTILILGMTVTLFSTIILWVGSFPTPIAQTRVDIESSMSPLTTNAQGGPVGVQIILTHRGGEALYPVPTFLYVTDQAPSGQQTTDVLTLHTFSARLAHPNGLLDGPDNVWSIGERWEYQNLGFNVTDRITVTVVDTYKGMVVWIGDMSPAGGTRPPIFLNVWAASVDNGIPNPVYEGVGFYLYADVFAPDNNLNPNSVYARILAFNGSASPCAQPLPMNDAGKDGDLQPGDGIFTLGSIFCTSSPYPAREWTGTYVLLNATDFAGHHVSTRFTLSVLPNPGSITNLQTIPSQLWQYIGYVQIRTGEVWLSNLSLPYGTTNTFQPFRVPKSWMSAGVLFHFKMANHGNTTIFVDGWTEAFFQNTQSSAGTAMFIVAPCSPTTTAIAGGVIAYPGTSTNINNFQYAYSGNPSLSGCSSTVPPAVFDINPTNQETGGTPYTVVVNAKTAFSNPTTSQWQSATYFMSILVSGMAGPQNYTYAMLTGNGNNPFNCPGLGANYNPILHLSDTNPECRTQWYAQVIPFIGMVVY